MRDLREGLAGRAMSVVAGRIVGARLGPELLADIMQMAQLVQRGPLLGDQQESQQGQSQCESKPAHARRESNDGCARV